MPPRKIKVCCFCERWESGGIESFLHNVLQHLDLKKFQVDIVTSSLCQSVFTRPLRDLGVRFFELSGNQRNLFQNHKLFLDLLKREKYDVVYLNIFHGLSLYYVKLAKRADIPIRIAHSHNTALRKSILRPLKLLLHQIAKQIYTDVATDLWACSKNAAEFLFSEKVLREKGFQFIPNGIDTERFQFDAERRKGIRRDLGVENKFVIGNIGRLCYQKNQDFLLDIFAEVKKKMPESSLLLVGEGDDLEALKQKAKILCIEDAVIFYGTSSDVEKLLWTMDVFVFPSRFEGLGIVAIEAQTAGLPVICSEYVPQEACVTPLFQQLKLEAGAETWAKRVLEMKATNRKASAKTVALAGFDIQTIAERIGKKWKDCKIG